MNKHDFLNKRRSHGTYSTEEKEEENKEIKVNKKVLFIGDIHGRTDWRETAIQGLKKFQEVVLLGDYFDSFDHSAALQIDNFMQVLSFIRKKKNVTALLGNHDYAYIHSYHSTSGYQHSQAPTIKKLLDDNRDLFKIAWGYKDSKGNYTLATHAGLTYGYWTKHIIPMFEDGFLKDIFGDKGPSDIPLHEILNTLIDKKELMWKVGPRRGGWGHPGPLWADYHELLDDPYPGINQVVGHTVNHAPSVDLVDDKIIARIDSWGPKTAALVLGI